jgi:putative ABC transport system ATP-binding protein
MIRVTKVSKEYGGRHRVTALAEVDLEIAKGELVAIVGPSGSGKSTILNLIGALDSPSSGEITIDGQALSGLTDRERTAIRRDKIGFIFQFFHLLPSLSAVDNVALPLHLRRWPRRRIDERARELLLLVGLAHRSDHLPDELSGGERQRVAIARALSIYPPILLGDEPTGNLDTETGADILALIRDVHARLGATIVIVTHDPSVAAACGRIVRMRNGRIVEDAAG